jgi:hypothetical protein
MTASGRLWPQEFANATSALADQERFLSAVGQRDSDGSAANAGDFLMPSD